VDRPDGLIVEVSGVDGGDEKDVGLMLIDYLVGAGVWTG